MPAGIPDAPQSKVKLQPGSRVRLHGLESAELNGELGTCSAWGSAVGRWIVLLQKTFNTVAVRPENLQVVAADAWSKDSCQMDANASCDSGASAQAAFQGGLTPKETHAPLASQDTGLPATLVQANKVGSDASLAVKAAVPKACQKEDPGKIIRKHFQPKSSEHVAGDLVVLDCKSAAAGQKIQHHEAAASAPQICPGVTVRLVGLKASPEFNGLLGKCVGWNDKESRWEVDLPKAGQKKLKQANLEVVVSQPSVAKEREPDNLHRKQQIGGQVMESGAALETASARRRLHSKKSMESRENDDTADPLEKSPIAAAKYHNSLQESPHTPVAKKQKTAESMLETFMFTPAALPSPSSAATLSSPSGNKTCKQDLRQEQPATQAAPLCGLRELDSEGMPRKQPGNASESTIKSPHRSAPQLENPSTALDKPDGEPSDVLMEAASDTCTVTDLCTQPSLTQGVQNGMGTAQVKVAESHISKGKVNSNSFFAALDNLNHLSFSGSCGAGLTPPPLLTEF